MEHEIVIRLISFVLVFILVALWEIRAPRRTLTTSKKWRWFNNAIVTFKVDETCEATNGATGTWRRLKSGKYEIEWKPKGEKEVKWIDTLQLSAIGTELTGKNRKGDQISGTLIGH